jgi:hypothetical protein
MAFDVVPDSDPRGPWRPKCARPIAEGEPTTVMHFHEDPDGSRGLSGKRWHAECARPYWDKFSQALDTLNNLWGRF